MSLPDIDFTAIRLHRGLRSDAFEELCCQLASDEAGRLGARFIRKGRGADAGLEAFAVVGDDEIGWQVKYYWGVDEALASLSGSLETALTKHPKMNRFIACLPFDLADGRKNGETTALQKWQAWHDAETAKATKLKRTILIECWSASDLKKRLIDGAHGPGRIAFWFDEAFLSPDWFRQKFARAQRDLGARYTPEASVALPLRHAILATTRDPAFAMELERLHGEIRDARSRVGPPTDQVGIDALAAADRVIRSLKAAADLTVEDYPQHALAKDLEMTEAALAEWRRAAYSATLRNDDLVRGISRLHSRTVEAWRRLASSRWRLVNARRLLIFGEGGRGKSHLLADVCQQQIAGGRPALLILAHKLRNEEPWAQIVSALDLPRHLRREEFLSALNAAAHAAGVRALVAVDGLNERDGAAIWSSHLAAFLHDVEAFPWISVVASCRTTYLDTTIPASLDEPYLPRLEHEGFSASEAARYLDMRGVQSLEAPWPLAEFETPLFLKTLCDGLALRGETQLPKGSRGLSAIFTQYADAVANQLSRSLKLNPKLNHVQRALRALAVETARTGDPLVPYERADALVSAILPHDGGLDRDLLFQLTAEGVLATELIEEQEFVRFTFERYGDFTVAAGLLEGCSDATAVAARLKEKSPLVAALNTPSRQLQGLLEALAVLLPERYGVELTDLSLPMTARLLAPHAFTESLTTRDAQAFTARTWELVGEERKWDVLIQLAGEPTAQPGTADLHSLLSALTMPERDATWSAHLADSTAARHLIEWALQPRAGVLAEDRAQRLAVVLTWFFTTSDRAVRDRATKGLVSILTDHPRAVLTLLGRFTGVDDGYLLERLCAALYGAALQGRWAREDAAAIAADVDHRLFREAPPLNCLTREHGRLLIQWAIHVGALPADYDLGPSTGPYTSIWPIEHVPDAVIDAFAVTHPDGYTYRDAIVRSCVADGDFARYVLDRAVDNWSPALKGTDPLPTRKALHDIWERDFRLVATPEQLGAYAALQNALAAADRVHVFREDAAVTEAKAAFAAAVGSELYERWREEAENWRRSGMYQRPIPRTYAEFNLAWARRWVCWRAHQLGWSPILHGAFDDRANNGRMSHTHERIGKKYQWLALYELRARMADNLEPVRSRRSEGPDELRNIDPSLLAGTENEDSEEFDTAPINAFEPWREAVDLPAISLEDSLIWRDDDEDLPDGLGAVEIHQDGQRWLALKRFDVWRGGPDELYRELSRWVTAVVVPRNRLRAFLALVEGQTELDHDDFHLGEKRVPWRSYLGEHPWLWGDYAKDGWRRSWRPRFAQSGTGVSVRALTLNYLAEDSGYDQSLARTVDAELPSPWLINSLGLRLHDGRKIAYVDDAGQIIYQDPSSEERSITAALVDQKAFLAMLKRERLAAVWLIGGEKNVYGRHSDGFGGRRHYARVLHTTGGDLVTEKRASKLDEPSKDQLQALRDAAD